MLQGICGRPSPLKPRIIPLKRLSDCRQEPTHVQAIVKFQFEASSCYMSRCEKENFWPTFGCRVGAVAACLPSDLLFSDKVSLAVSPQNETEKQKTREGKCVGSFIMRLSSGSIGALNAVVFTSVCGAEPAQVAKFNISNDVKHLLGSSDYIFREFRIS